MDGHAHFPCLETALEGSAAGSLHVLVLGEQSVKDPQSGFEVQVHHICRRKQTDSWPKRTDFQELEAALPHVQRKNPSAAHGHTGCLGPWLLLSLSLCSELLRWGVTFRAGLGLLESSVQHQFKGKGHIVHLPETRQQQGQ